MSRCLFGREDGFTVRRSGIKIGLLLWHVASWGDWIGVYTGHGKKYWEVGLGIVS